MLMLCSVCFAQKKAVTETGEEVVLYDNGKWEYINVEDNDSQTIKENSTKFCKGSDSTFLLKSKKINVGLWLDPKKWNFKNAQNNPEAEYEFQLKGEDLYGMFISEKIEIPVESLSEIAFTNAKNVAPDMKVISKEYRIVNGQKVICMHMNGTLQGMKFSYFGYYFSNEKGSLQLLMYTSQNLLKSYMSEVERFLNGMELTKS